MRRYRAQIFFGLAILVALITSVLVFSWLRSATDSSKPTAQAAIFDTTTVVVAKDHLTAGTKLVEEMLVLATYPTGHLPEGYISHIEALRDRVLVMGVKKHEPILLYKVADTKGRAGIAAVTDPNKRAMSVQVDEVIGVSGFIKPGDRVDVMVTIQPNTRSNMPVAKIILENVKVLAAGPQWEKSSDDQKPKPVQVITLEVDVREAETLALASTQGRLRLALRNPLNSETVLTHGVNVRTLLASYRPKPRYQGNSKYKTYKVEVIKGNERETVKFRLKE